MNNYQKIKKDKFSKACGIGDLEKVKFFIEKEIRNEKCIGFYCACRNNCIEIAELLINNNMRDDKDCIGFRCACDNGHVKIVEFLKKLK